MTVHVRFPGPRVALRGPPLALACVGLASLALACITQRNPRFLAAVPRDARGSWAIATEEPAATVTDGAGNPVPTSSRDGGHRTVQAPADGRLLVADPARGAAGVRLCPPEDTAQERLVIYHVMVAFFANGDPANDGQLAERSWLYAGGDLMGVIQRLDHIASLGVNALWLSPVFESPSDHGYDVTNYYEISPALGVAGDRAASKALFRELVRRAHSLGLRVILDIPLNHGSTAYDLAAGNPGGFPVRSTGPKQLEERFFFTGRGSRFAYWDFDDPQTREFVAQVALHWIRDEDVDGFRLDYARGVPPSFWTELRKRLRAVKPDVFLVGEVWPLPWEGVEPMVRGYRADPQPGLALDSLLDFPTCFAVTCVFNDSGRIWGAFAAQNFGGDRSPIRLERVLQETEARYPDGAQPTYFLDNHDLSRFANYSGDRRRLKAAFTFLSTLSGHLALYYGTETGLISPAVHWAGEHTSQQPMPWGELDGRLVEWFRRAIAVRRQHASLSTGARLPLHADERTLVMAKVGTAERALVGVNLSAEEVVVEVQVGALLDASAGGATVLGETAPEIRGGKVRWRLPPVSTSVFVQPSVSGSLGQGSGERCGSRS